jgi:hypothetical protein
MMFETTEPVHWVARPQGIEGYALKGYQKLQAEVAKAAGMFTSRE